jgi:hypothetical protein
MKRLQIIALIFIALLGGGANALAQQAAAIIYVRTGGVDANGRSIDGDSEAAINAMTGNLNKGSVTTHSSDSSVPLTSYTPVFVDTLGSLNSFLSNNTTYGEIWVNFSRKSDW